MNFLFLFFSIIQVTKCWIILYETTLISQSQCQNQLLDQYWKTSTGSLIQQCNDQCQLSVNNPLIIVLDTTNSYISITIPIPQNFSSMYRQFGVDAIIHQDGQPDISIQINNNPSQVTSNFMKTLFTDSFQYKCGNKNYNLYKISSNIILNNLPQSLEMKFLKGKPNKEFGIRSVRIWASCAKNCKVCYGMDDCQTCFSGLQRFIFPETGKGACETTQNCNIANCFSCALSSTRNVCLKCKAGYTLDSSYQCQVNSGATCPTGQYRTSGGNCFTYSNQCYFEDKQTGNLTNCNGIEDVTKYQCQYYEYIYILDKYNYGEVRCGCNDVNCSTCSSYQNCTTCQTGYQHNSQINQCEKMCQQEGTYYNSTSYSCQNCSDSKCQSCTSNSCLQCKTGFILNLTTNLCVANCPDGQYFNPSSQLCQNCSSGCQICTSSNNCSQCQTNLVWNSNLNKCVVTCTSPQLFDTSTETCITCESNCLNCTSTTCSQCLDNTYQIDQLDQKKCQRIPLNCSSNQYYNESSYTCVNCSSFCLTCNSNTCLTCFDNTYQIDNSNPQICKRIPLNCQSNQYEDYSNYICVNCSQFCKTCNQSACLTCIDNTYQIDNTNPKMCSRIPFNCLSNQYYDETSYSCINCQQYCSTCDQNTCTSCIDNTYQIDNTNQKNCKRIPLNCQSNQYEDYINYTCVNCSQNCQTCNSNTCLTCIHSTYEIDQTNVKQCKLIPLNCPQNQYYNELYYVCVNCGQNCSSCNSSTCFACIDNTYEIDSTNQKKCKKIPLNCSQGTYYDEINFVCVICKQNCLSCDKNKCLQCKSSYQNDINNLQNCLLIPLNCKSNEYYDQINNTCEQCKQNCALCTQNQCNQCTDSTYVIDTQNQTQCILRTCTSKCSVCDTLSCKKCINNFKIDENSPLNCIQNCEVTNCINCLEQNPNQCSQCKDGYNINTKDYSCEFICEVNNCSQCELNNKNQCKICNQYFSLTQQTKKCKEICQMKNCSECISDKPFICKTCQNGYTLDLNEQFCYKPDQKANKFSVQQSLEDNIYTFKIMFEQKLIQDLINYEISKHIIEVKIENRNDYTFQYEQKSLIEIDIKLTMQNGIKNKQLQILFNSNQFIMENNLDNNKQNIDLYPHVMVSEQQQQAGKKIGSVAQGVSMSLTSSFLPIITFSNFYVLVNTIDLTAFYYYILFIDVRMPQNVLSFFAIFQNFQFPFIPNMFEIIIDDNYVQYSPKKFVENGCQGYFITNGGQSITICCGVVFLYFLFRIGQIIPIRFMNQYCSRVIQNTWHFSGFLDMFCTVYIYLLFAVFLQFYQFEFEDSISPLNYILFLVSALITIVFPFFILKLLYNTKNVKSNLVFQQKYQTLLSGLNLYDQKEFEQSDISTIYRREQIGEENTQRKYNSQNFDTLSSPTVRQSDIFHISNVITKSPEKNYLKYSKYYSGLCYLKKLIFAIIITYFHKHQYPQLVLVSILSILFIFYLLYIKPFQKNYENIKLVAGEVSLIIIYICTCFLVKDSDEQEEDERYNIGWVIIGLSGFIIIWNTLQIIFELFISIYKIIKSILCSKNKSNKVQDFNIVVVEDQQKLSDNSCYNKQEKEQDIQKARKKSLKKEQPNHFNFKSGLPNLNLRKNNSQTKDDYKDSTKDFTKDLTKDDNNSFQASPSIIPLKSPFSYMSPIINQEMKLLSPTHFSIYNNQNEQINHSQKTATANNQLDDIFTEQQSTRRKRISVQQKMLTQFQTPRQRQISSPQVQIQEVFQS